MTDDRAQVVTRWSERAQAYDTLLRTHALLPDVARRLVQLLPADVEDVLDVLDVGAGTGLVSELVLERHPAARVHLCEPVAPMRALAQARLGDRLASVQPLWAEEVDQDLRPVDAVLANACLHLADLPRAISAIARRLRPGGVLAFNLWDHAWAPTAPGSDSAPLWREPLAAALEEAGHDPGAVPPPVERPAPIEPQALLEAAQAAGLGLRIFEPDFDEVPATFFVDFAAMDASLLADLPDRGALLERARGLATGSLTTASTRFLCTAAQRS